MVPSAREDAPGPGGRPRPGREEAERLVETTYRRVFATLYRMTGGNHELAADLTQETYRKAWQSLDRFQGRSSLWTWLYRIAYTTFLDHLRRPRPVPIEDAVPDPPAPDPSPAERAEARELADRLRRAVLELPETLRFTVAARYWGELSAREIASAEGVSRIAVHKRLRRAHALLRAALEELS